jgi:endonuclease/exonuclease/phosphatase family metal-dependent hydrolase
VSASDPRSLRIVSYNVHSCIGTDGVFSPQRIAAVLADLDADIVALQEVEDKQVDGMSVTAYLMRELRLVLAAKTTHLRTGLDYGNVLLSRTPPVHTASHDLAHPKREPRAAIEANFEEHGAHLRVFATHFGLSLSERRAQVQRLLPRLDDASPSLTVLCADFNEWLPYSHLHRMFGRQLGIAPAVRSFPSRFAVLSLDRIYVRPLSALANTAAVRTSLARVASDHLPVVADFNLGGLVNRDPAHV